MLRGNKQESRLLSGIAVLSFKANYYRSGYSPARDISPRLSALITTSKVLVVY
jgi:hypothetical protein